MVIKKISKALESTIFIGANLLNKIDKLAKIPWGLLKEADKFIRRNSLIVVAHRIEDKRPIHECCESCLEAHLIKKANEMKFDNDVKRNIKQVFNCEIGHEGYYLDKGRLIRV